MSIAPSVPVPTHSHATHLHSSKHSSKLPWKSSGDPMAELRDHIRGTQRQLYDKLMSIVLRVEGLVALLYPQFRREDIEPTVSRRERPSPYNHQKPVVTWYVCVWIPLTVTSGARSIRLLEIGHECASTEIALNSYLERESCKSLRYLRKIG